MSDEVRPNLVIAGAARSGSTALAEALGRHPSIGLPSVKEPHFLAHVGTEMDYRGPGDDVVNREVITSASAYDALFGGVGEHPIRIDASMSTLPFHHRSIPAIDTHLGPDTKVVVILREPVARARSAYLFLRSRGLEPAESFAEGLSLEDQRRAAGYHHLWWYRGLSRYGDQVESFAAHFGDRFRIVIAEEFQKRPYGVVEELFRWIDVDPSVDVGPFPSVNRGGQPRSMLAARVLHAARSQPAARAAVRLVTPRALRERIVQRNLARDTDGGGEDAVVFHELRAEFATDVQSVERHLGRALPEWTTVV